MGQREKETFVQQQFLTLPPQIDLCVCLFSAFWAPINDAFSLLREYWHLVIYEWLKASVLREDYLSLTVTE